MDFSLALLCNSGIWTEGFVRVLGGSKGEEPVGSFSLLIDD